MTFPYEDADLDRQLQDVSLPGGFLARLKKLGELPDAELDRALLDVPLPPGFEYRLRATLRKRRPSESLNRLMLAASVLIALGAIYFGALALSMAGKHAVVGKQNRGEGLDPPMAPQPPIRFGVAEDESAVRKQIRPRGVENNSSMNPELRSPTHVPSDPRQDAAEQVVVKSTVPVRTDSQATSGDNVVVKAINGGNKSADQVSKSAVDGESSFAAEQIYGTPLARQPELPLVSGLKPRGLAPPHVKGYDITFQLKNREQPFVVLSAAPSLKTSLVPIVTDPASFNALRRSVQAGKLPPADALRLEELLAAVDYHFPPPTGAPLALRTAAGPSPFSAGNVLLQVGVQAATLKPAKSAADCLLIALDSSSNLQTPGRLSRLREALSQFASRQPSANRTMVFEYSDRAELVANLRGASDSASLAALKLQPLATRVDWTTGLKDIIEQSLELSKQVASPPRIVVISAGPSEISAASLAQLDRSLDKCAAAGIKLDAIDIDQEETDVNPLLERCARQGHGSQRKAESVEKLRWALAEINADCSLVAADNVRLKVNFNPKAVLAYRLIGHEATAGGGLLSGPLSDELRSGQAATALYEVTLKPDGEAQLAVAEVSWSPPGITAPKKLTQQIVRLQVANSLIESPLSLQAAALAAELGEVLRNSHFAPGHAQGLRRVRELAAQSNPLLLENPSIVDLLDVADKALRLSLAGKQ